MSDFSPFSPNYEETIASLGELKLIRQISHWTEKIGLKSPKGIGDDCAVFQTGPNTSALITTDSLSFNQHFDNSVSPQSAGSKLIKRNLSDIAAMGGQPKCAVLALLCGPNVSIKWLQAFFEGIQTSCTDYQIRLIGGDISSIRSGEFSSVLTLIGESNTSKERKSAELGDHIYVTGSLGGSILKKHHTFEPRLQEGQWLNRRPEVTSMMDLTDGLAKDLPALLPDAYSAALFTDAIPLSVDAVQLTQTSHQSPHFHAFCDGEDYELLFTVKYNAEPNYFENAWKKQFPDILLSKIGTVEIKHSSNRLLDAATKKALPWTHGFEHLKP